MRLFTGHAGRGVLARIAVGCALLLGSTLAHANVAIQVINGQADPVQLAVTVTDTNGNPVVNLTQPDFQLQENGNDLTGTLSNFRAPPSQGGTGGISVVFVMDDSTSLSNEIGPIQDAVTSFIHSMAAGDQVALVKFTGGIDDVIPGFYAISNPPDTAIDTAVTSPINPADDKYGSHVFDAVAYAIQLLQQNPAAMSGRAAVILLTDGQDVSAAGTPETNTLDSLTQLLQTANIPVFPIGFGKPDGTTLATIAQASGTEYVSANDAAAFQQVQADIANLLQNGYLMSYQSGVSKTDCTPATLTVTVQPGQPSTQSGQTTFTRCATSTGAPPTIQPVGLISQPAGQPMSLQISATGGNGTPLSFSATGLPPGVSIDSNTGLISGTPSQQGTYHVQVSVTDGQSTSSMAFTLTITAPTGNQGSSTGGTSSGGGSGGGSAGPLFLALAGLWGGRRLLRRR